MPGRRTTVVAELEGHVREHPLRESLRRQLMLALYRSGRQADALAAYRAARRALVEQCGIEPNLAMQRLERAILNQDPALDGAPSSVAQRSIMVAALVEARTEELATLAAALARRPAREVIVAQAIARDGDLGAASARLQRLQQALAAVGVTARAAAFISEAPGGDLARIAVEQETDLVVADAPERLLDDTVLAEILRTAPCDVAVSVGSPAAAPCWCRSQAPTTTGRRSRSAPGWLGRAVIRCGWPGRTTASATPAGCSPAPHWRCSGRSGSRPSRGCCSRG